MNNLTRFAITVAVVLAIVTCFYLGMRAVEYSEKQQTLRVRGYLDIP